MKRFRITSEKGYYFICKVFDAKSEMYTYYLKRCKRFRLKPEKLNFAAMVQPYHRIEKLGSEVKHKNIGEAIFYKGRLGFGLTCHEMLHCALWHERWIEGNENAEFGKDIGEVEERLCYTLTEYGRQFNEKCHKYGLYQ